jgi:hypothetical protein
MRTRRPINRVLVYTVLVAFAAVALVPAVALAFDIGDVLKIFGMGMAIKQFADPINKFINKALGERGAEARGATKVVPIISIGKGGYIGAAQVVGVPDGVRKIKAVVQVEARFGDVGGNLFVPVDTTNPGNNPKAVSGVGVSAIIDLRI